MKKKIMSECEYESIKYAIDKVEWFFQPVGSKDQKKGARDLKRVLTTLYKSKSNEVEK